MFVCNRGDTVSRRSPIKEVRPSFVVIVAITNVAVAVSLNKYLTLTVQAQKNVDDPRNETMQPNDSSRIFSACVHLALSMSNECLLAQLHPI